MKEEKQSWNNCAISLCQGKGRAPMLSVFYPSQGQRLKLVKKKTKTRPFQSVPGVLLTDHLHLSVFLLYMRNEPGLLSSVVYPDFM